MSQTVTSLITNSVDPVSQMTEVTNNVSLLDPLNGLRNGSEDGNNYYYYDYEVTYNVAPVTFIYICAVFGLLMNGFTLAVMLSFKTLRKHNANLLIINQSVLDCVASFCLLLTYSFWIRFGDQLSKGDIFDKILCHLFMKEQAFWMCFSASTFNLVAISCERYLVVVHSIWHKVHVKRWHVYVAMMLVWTLPLVFNIPDTFYVLVKANYCSNDYHKRSATFEIIFTLIYFFGTFSIPLLIIIYAYLHIIVVIVKSRKRVKPANQVGQNSQTIGTEYTKTQSNLTKTAALVATAFVLCLLPYQTYFILWNGLGHVKYIDNVYYVTLCISLLNLSVNPVIYALTMKTFKTALLEALSARVCGVKTNVVEVAPTTNSTTA